MRPASEKNLENLETKLILTCWRMNWSDLQKTATGCHRKELQSVFNKTIVSNVESILILIRKFKQKPETVLIQ